MYTFYTSIANMVTVMNHIVANSPDYTGAIVTPLRKPFNAIEIQIQYEDNVLRLMNGVYDSLEPLIPCHSESAEHPTFPIKGKAQGSDALPVR